MGITDDRRYRRDRRTVTSKRVAEKLRKDWRAIRLGLKKGRKDNVADIKGENSEQKYVGAYRI